MTLCSAVHVLSFVGYWHPVNFLIIACDAVKSAPEANENIRTAEPA